MEGLLSTGYCIYFPMQENMVCVSCTADLTIVEEVEKLKIPVMSQNWLVSAILQHKFDDRLTLKQ